MPLKGFLRAPGNSKRLSLGGSTHRKAEPLLSPGVPPSEVSRRPQVSYPAFEANHTAEGALSSRPDPASTHEAASASENSGVHVKLNTDVAAQEWYEYPSNMSQLKTLEVNNDPALNHQSAVTHVTLAKLLTLVSKHKSPVEIMILVDSRVQGHTALEPSFDSSLCFSNLRMLEVVYCPLDWLYTFLKTERTPLLQELKVTSPCEHQGSQLGLSVEAHILMRHPTLHKLVLHDCKLLEDILTPLISDDIFELRELHLQLCSRHTGPMLPDIVKRLLRSLPKLKFLQIGEVAAQENQVDPSDAGNLATTLFRAILPGTGQKSHLETLSFAIPSSPSERLLQDAARTWAYFDKLEVLGLNSRMIVMLKTFLPPTLRELIIYTVLTLSASTWGNIVGHLQQYWACDAWRGKSLKTVRMIIYVEKSGSEQGMSEAETVVSLQREFSKFQEEKGKEWDGFPSWEFQGLENWLLE